MIDFRNPYTPGAGVTPRFLAGREEILETAQHRIKAVESGYPARPIVFYGLRGVGKTVLLNAIEEMTDTRDLLCKHIEVKEDSNFVKSLAIACNGFVQQLSTKEKLKDRAGKMFSLMRAFVATWNPEDKSFSLEMKDQMPEIAVAGTGDLSNDFTELLVMLGKYAKQADTAIFFCIDEIQYAKEAELEALITANHRINQLGLPVMFFCAGLPKILKEMGDAKSYTERLFEFVEIGSLSVESARDAIIVPAKDLDVDYTEEAVQKILDETKGYPYFIQEICSTIWENHDGKQIDLDAVVTNIPAANKKLDAGFFQVRYDRCTGMEKQFMAGMVNCGELPCTIANVATAMGRTARSISPYRSQLIHKGLIYATSYGEIDFTVPRFDEFMKRAHPELIQG